MVVDVLLSAGGVPALSLGYAATVVRLWSDPAWQRTLLPFSYVGRMALTNYLLQSVICTMIFYSYGLGLYGRVGPLLDLPLRDRDLQPAGSVQPLVARQPSVRTDGMGVAAHLTYRAAIGQSVSVT